MNDLQYIGDKQIESGYRMVLWRKGEYTYEIEFTAHRCPSVLLTDTEYYDAVAEFEKLHAAKVAEVQAKWTNK